jgi:hypothetical protein
MKVMEVIVEGLTEYDDIIQIDQAAFPCCTGRSLVHLRV